ncbi:universal stress protein [Aquimarina brevivitae]|uniref:Nucleotide-binding universal stress UspA family protein n=1 Tax=Aquimarina brevivitae TaxID=323412 RepID=A0A4Q7PGN3_9FLAO|nr:universal stress protein [Aquimarina brevivitae]RZS99674.1 nucleotide-binding universal stress UspA family protein [Aquimarina brevivitae]
MNKILVPVDFSKYSTEALKVAAHIAKKQNAEIVALHMLGITEAVLIKNEEQEVAEAMYYMKLAEKQFDSLLQEDFLADVKITERVLNHKVFSEINDLATELDIDLIIMGSHGTTNLREDVFIGSNTEKVVRTSNVPVLVIKENAEDFKMESAVFACDFKLPSLKAYHNAIKLFERFDMDFTLLYINLPGERFRSNLEIDERIKGFLTKADPETADEVFKKVVYWCDFSVEKGVFHYSNKINADIIAIPTHGRRGLAHFFSGSIGEDIANHATKPVITFKM